MIAFAVALSGGCADGPKLDLEDYYAANLRARCQQLARCGLFASEESCTGFFRVPDLAELLAAIDAGKIRYDGGRALECHDALAALTCDQSARDARVVPACDEVFAGRVDDGEPCAFDLECASGRCDEAQCPFDTCCSGACLASETRGALDDACETDRGCPIDAYCGKDARCHALGGAGATCARDAECDYGLACIGASELMDGNCRAMPKLGERCPYQRCAELGAYCDASTMCAPVGLPGAPCTSDRECSTYGRCDLDQGRCVDLPTLGMPCIGGCAGESWCNLTTMMCEAPLSNGAPCTSDNQCATLFCREDAAFDQCADRPVCL